MNKIHLGNILFEQQIISALNKTELQKAQQRKSAKDAPPAWIAGTQLDCHMPEPNTEHSDCDLYTDHCTDHDTPTANDNCDHFSVLVGIFCDTNTYALCDKDDWCGWYHETTCDGPAVTDIY